MWRIVLLAGSVLWLQACNVDRGKKVDASQLDFTTSDRAEMFFKNVRQSYYRVVENAEAGVYLYTNKYWEEAADAHLVPVIAFNWRQDRAYVMLRWSDSLAQLAEVRVLTKNDTLADATLTYSEGDMGEQLRFALGCYNALVDGSELLIAGGRNDVPLLANSQEREAFRVTIFDYLRLTGRF